MACLHQFLLNVVKINFNEYEMIEHSDEGEQVMRKTEKDFHAKTYINDHAKIRAM